MNTQGATLEMESAVNERMQRPDNHHFSDGSELIPSEVAAKGIPERETPLTPHSEMSASEKDQPINSLNP